MWRCDFVSRIRRRSVRGGVGLALALLLAGADPAAALSTNATAQLIGDSNAGLGTLPNCAVSNNTPGEWAICNTTAGSSRSLANWMLLAGSIDTTGTLAAGSALHSASVNPSFSETVTAAAASAGALRATFELAGTSLTSGAMGSLALIFSGATVLSATNASTINPSSAHYTLGPSGALFSETIVVDWDFIPGAELSMGVGMSLQTSQTGLIGNFADTFVLDQLEAFDTDGQPLAFTLTDGEGTVLASSVPEPATGLLLGMGLAGLAYRKLRAAAAGRYHRSPGDSAARHPVALREPRGAPCRPARLPI